MKKILKPFRYYADLTRTEETDECTIVEGYAYVNARVRSDKFNLLRSTMENAVEGYMKFPAIREMHDPRTAAGTCVRTEWDEIGLKITAEIVDPVARTKVQRGVYRGFSVFVRPVVMRGDAIVQGDWVETSLADRPADADTVFTAIRTEGGEFMMTRSEDSEDVEVECQRSSFAEYVGNSFDSQVRSVIGEALWNAVWDLQNTASDDKAAKVATLCDDLREVLTEAVVNNRIVKPLDEDAERVARVEAVTPLVATVPQDVLDNISRLDSTVTVLQSDLARANAEIERLANSPMPGHGPVLMDPANITRVFNTPISFSSDPEAKKLREGLQSELARIEQEAPKMNQTERADAAVRIGQIKHQLQTLQGQ